MINPVRAARAAFCLTAATGLHRRTAAFYTTLGLGTTGALRTSLVGATRIMSTTAGGASDGQPAQDCVYQDGKAFRLQGEALEKDWVKDLDLSGAKALLSEGVAPPKILVLYGSLRQRSYSKLLAYEFARVLDLLGCDVHVFDPQGLPMKDDVSEKHERVQELRRLSQWSEGQVWVSPEQHGTITAVFKNQIDWIPLSLGSVRPTQGRTLAIAQVNGGSQSFNVVNILRVLGRWMRMITIPNQSSVPKAWTEFEPDGRMKPSSFRDRVVDVAEELFKFTILLRPHADYLVDRYSEREEKKKEGRLLSQAEKEARARKEKAAAAAAAAAAATTVDAAGTGSDSGSDSSTTSSPSSA